VAARLKPRAEAVAKMQLNHQVKNKAALLRLVYDLIFPEGDVWDARPL
jgi:hypothetical protein